jgi:hypothetical protein
MKKQSTHSNQKQPVGLKSTSVPRQPDEWFATIGEAVNWLGVTKYNFYESLKKGDSCNGYHLERGVARPAGFEPSGLKQAKKLTKPIKPLSRRKTLALAKATAASAARQRAADATGVSGGEDDTGTGSGYPKGALWHSNSAAKKSEATANGGRSARDTLKFKGGNSSAPKFNGSNPSLHWRQVAIGKLLQKRVRRHFGAAGYFHGTVTKLYRDADEVEVKFDDGETMHLSHEEAVHCAEWSQPGFCETVRRQGGRLPTAGKRARHTEASGSTADSERPSKKRRAPNGSSSGVGGTDGNSAGTRVAHASRQMAQYENRFAAADEQSDANGGSVSLPWQVRAERAEERVRYLEQKLDTASELLKMLQETVFQPPLRDGPHLAPAPAPTVASSLLEATSMAAAAEAAATLASVATLPTSIPDDPSEAGGAANAAETAVGTQQAEASLDSAAGNGAEGKEGTDEPDGVSTGDAACASE